MNRILFLALALTSLFPGLTVAQMTSSATPGPASGIEGTISAGPTRGGPMREGDSASVPVANMAFVVKQAERVVASFTTDDKGRFRVILDPGHYTVVRKDHTSSVGSFGPFEVDVSASKMTSVTWDCDTGLR